MKLAHRLGYYFFGFIIGLFFLFFFLGGKKASCDYGPNARVLKNIRIKKQRYSEQVKSVMLSHAIDSSIITTILQKGNVDFGKSNTEKDSCKTYYVTGIHLEQEIGMHIDNCHTTAVIQTMTVTKP